MKNDNFDIARIREEFPILSKEVGGHPLVYLDNAATTQKPLRVIEALDRYYRQENANIHRGVHYLSAQATDAFEKARRSIAKFINAEKESEVIFVRGTTEGINLVASSYGRRFVGEGDNIVISALEHHANIVPWQLLGDEKKIELRVIPMDEKGVLDLSRLPELIDEKTRLVSVGYISNALGTVNPVKEIIAIAHGAGVRVLIDGAQSVPHYRTDVQDLDCDFFVFSGHKAYGPTGIGVLYGKEQLLNTMPPYQGGGDMIRAVSFEKTTYRDVPERFEAGTPHISGAIGLAAALDFLKETGLDSIRQYEEELFQYGIDTLNDIPDLRFYGTGPHRAGALSFLIGDIHPHDIGTFLDSAGIAVRSGHHCAQPIMKFFNIAGTVRASLALYNTKEEIDKLAANLRKIRAFFM